MTLFFEMTPPSLILLSWLPYNLTSGWDAQPKDAVKVWETHLCRHPSTESSAWTEIQTAIRPGDEFSCQRPCKTIQLSFLLQMGKWVCNLILWNIDLEMWFWFCQECPREVGIAFRSWIKSAWPQQAFSLRLTLIGFCSRSNLKCKALCFLKNIALFIWKSEF